MKDLQALLDPSALQPSIIDGLPFSDYLAINAVNQSAAKRVRWGSMLSVRAVLSDTGDETQTQVQRLGDLVHMIVHEPDRFDDTVVVGPKEHGNSRVWRDFVKAHPTKKVVKEGEVDEAYELREVIDAHPLARKLVANAQCEQSMVWWDEDVGIWCRGRADYLIDGQLIADLKTAKSADADKFSADASEIGHLFQAAFLLRGYRLLRGDALPFSWLVVEKGKNKRVELFDADEEDIVLAEQTVVRVLHRIALAIKHDHWPNGLRMKRWAWELHPERFEDVGSSDDAGGEPALAERGVM